MHNINNIIYLFKQVLPEPISRKKAEQIRFSQEVKQQFLKLKEKGLAIPVFTL